MRDIVVRIILLTLVLTSTAAAGRSRPGLGFSQATASRVFILSVGVDKYHSSSLQPQKYAVADAVSLSGQLEARNSASGYRIAQNGPSAYIEQKTSQVTRILLKDDQVTREQLAQAFNEIARDITADDIFFFSYAGIGAAVNGEFQLLTPAADYKTEGTKVTEITNAISTSELQALFRKIRARNKLIVLDSCDSAAGYDALSSAFIESDEKLRSAVAANVLFIGTDGLTTESPKLGHGVLTQVVLDGLSGQADFDENGVVSAAELEAYTYCGAMKYKGGDSSLTLSPRTVRSGQDFNVAFTDKKQKELAKKKPIDSEPSRAERFGSSNNATPVSQRNGDDYALLFANSYVDDTNWNELKNPVNDVTDIARELRERYGFREVVVKENLSTREIRETLTAYQSKEFPKPDDQLFIFFAGHGVTNRVSDIASNSYYVGSGAPRFSIEDSGHFMPLDSILQMIAGFKINHVMTVFDACFAGQIWKPAVATYSRRASIDLSDDRPMFASLDRPSRGVGKRFESIFETERILDERLVFAKRTMATQSRIVLTSGNRPVLDAFRRADGSLSRNSPFADKLLEVLREGGRNFNVLTANEIYTAVLGLPVQPMVGQMGGTDGDFVFVGVK